MKIFHFIFKIVHYIFYFISFNLFVTQVFTWINLINFIPRLGSVVWLLYILLLCINVLIFDLIMYCIFLELKAKIKIRVHVIVTIAIFILNGILMSIVP